MMDANSKRLAQFKKAAGDSTMDKLMKLVTFKHALKARRRSPPLHPWPALARARRLVVRCRGRVSSRPVPARRRSQRLALSARVARDCGTDRRGDR